MSEQVGARIREARTAAGMTQVQLSDAVETLSAKDISKIERGLREPSDEELAAIAKAAGTDVDSLLLDAAADGAPENPVEEAASTAMENEDILKLINAADPAVKEAALAVLSGKGQRGIKDLLGSVLPVISELLGSKETGSNPIPVLVGFLGSEDGAAFLETIKAAMSTVAGMFGGGGSDGEGKSVRKTSDSFLAFTFFYTVAIFVLLIGFHYMQAHDDIKLEL